MEYPRLSKSQTMHKDLVSRSNKPNPVHNPHNVALIQIENILRDFSQRGVQIYPLQAAVMTGNYSICKQLLLESATIAPTPSLPPPLCMALEMDRYQIARLLIDSGADVSTPHQGVYPMFLALKPHTPEYIVEAIIKAGFPPDNIIEEINSTTALHKAVVCKNVDVVKALTKLNADCNVKETKAGFTPLHLAVSGKSLQIAKVLIDNGADLEGEDKHGMTPLFRAVCSNDLLLLNFLLESGANVHHLCPETLVYPLNMAAHLVHNAIAKALIKHGADPSRVAPGTATLPIHSLAMSQNMKTADCAEQLEDMVELLTKQGLEVDVPNVCGNTPLQLAVLEGNFKLVEVLVKKGAGVNRIFEQGTIFHYVAKVAPNELICLFLEYGADYSIPDDKGNTIYHLAMFNRDSNVLHTFWEFGCPYDMPPSRSVRRPYRSKNRKKLDNQKMFMLGIKENNVSMMVKALSNGAEARGSSMEIPYPLHFAVSNSFSSVVLLLLEKSVPSNIINDKGESPLHIAARKGYSQIFGYLLRYGACYNLLTKPAGKTPFDLALENNQCEIFNILKEIDLMFKSSVNKSFEGLQKTFEKSKNVHSLQAYINCINREGKTLMANALKEKNYNLAENLIKLRLQIIKA